MNGVKLKNTIEAFLEKYKWWVHTLLVAWTTFVTSWASGLSIPLSDIGIPININGRDIIAYIQLHGHIPTKIMSLIMGLISLTLMYINWKKSHVQVIDVPAGSGVVLNPLPPSNNPGADKTVIEVKNAEGTSKT